MIESLPPGSLPLPSPPRAKEAGARVPAFLPWAMPERQPSPPAPSPSVSAIPPSIAPSLPPSSPPSPPRDDPSLPSVSMADDVVGLLIGIAPSWPGPVASPGATLPASGVPAASLPSAVLSPPDADASNGTFPTPSQASVDGPLSVPTESTLSPTDTIAIRVEAHLVDPCGRREIVIVPMRLRATGHLAQVADASSRSSGGASPWRDALPVPTPMAAETSVVSRPLILATSGLHPPTTEGEEGALQAWTGSFRADDADAEEALSSRSPPTAADTAAWLIRRMALVQQAGRAPTLWLRDYRLDPDEAFRVAAALHRLARDRGVVLDRIVINGHAHRSDSGAPPLAEPQE